MEMNSYHPVRDWLSEEEVAAYHPPEGFVHVGWFKATEHPIVKTSMPWGFFPFGDSRFVGRDWHPALMSVEPAFRSSHPAIPPT
jgi:hypothetical protein